MYKTILVPLDGSKRAEAILPHVEELAQSFGAKVVFLWVVEPVVTMGPPDGLRPMFDPEFLAELQREAGSYLAGLQGEFRKKGIEAVEQVVIGPVVKTIIDTAREEGADLIAMASHGRTGLSQVFYGSVAVGVLHSVDRPLLVVRSVDPRL
jgi:nucleotide-binding universal stress UspA family protein